MDERARRWEERFEWPMVIAALLVIPVLVIEESNFGQPWDAIGTALNWGTWLAFLVEAVVMVRVTPQPWQWVKRHPIDLAVIFLSPPFLPGWLAGARRSGSWPCWCARASRLGKPRARRGHGIHAPARGSRARLGPSVRVRITPLASHRSPVYTLLQRED